jgi:acyl-CoA thioester hydrolase
MKKTIETPIQKRFADIDMFRHVNNVHQQEYLDLGKEDYYHRVLGLEALTDSPTLMIVSIKNDFFEQVRYADDVVVRTTVDRIGTKSVTLRQQIVCRRNTTDGSHPLAADSAASSAIRSTAATSDAGETVCTESETVMVAFDRRSQQTLEIPASWRDKIAE